MVPEFTGGFRLRVLRSPSPAPLMHDKGHYQALLLRPDLSPLLPGLYA